MSNTNVLTLAAAVALTVFGGTAAGAAVDPAAIPEVLDDAATGKLATGAAQAAVDAAANAADATSGTAGAGEPVVDESGEPLRLEWPDLLPPVDDPEQAVAQLFDSYDLDKLLESDDALNDFIDRATDLNVNLALDGKLVSLPGFVLPLETTGYATREFLLLPYHGACIHVPPPPINQTVYVKMRGDEAAKIRGLFDTLVVTGILHAEKNVTGFANAGYRIDAIAAGKYR